jgi:hypothetical protein
VLLFVVEPAQGKAKAIVWLYSHGPVSAAPRVCELGWVALINPLRLANDAVEAAHPFAMRRPLPLLGTLNA